MDGTVATAVILIFVFSILGGVTGKSPRVSKPSTPDYTVSTPAYPTGTLHNEVTAGEVPSPFFSAGYTADSVNVLTSFIGKYAKKIDNWEAQSISENLVKYAQMYDVNPKLMCALIARESRFNRFAISSSGAQGLGQLLPSTSRGLGINDPFDIEQNVMGTTRYMRSLLDRFKDQPDKQVIFSIGGYLEGPNALKRNGGFTSATRGYIEDILKLYYKI